MIKTISIDLLVPFENHPFKERSGIEQQELTESIKENGLLEPIIVRSFPAGKMKLSADIDELRRARNSE